MEKPSLVPGLIKQNFSTIDGELAIGGIKASALTETYGTPLFVYDADIIRNNLRRLRDAVGNRFEIYYSVKANPNPEIIKILVQEGVGLEISSASEYVRACRAGGLPERIVFAGPCKSFDELEFVINRGIAEIHLESIEEIENVSIIGAQEGRSISVAIRINPIAAAQGGAMRMGGVPSQFGFDEEQLENVIKLVLSKPQLELTGIHLFAGTQILDADILLAQWAHGLGLAKRVSAIRGAPIASLDLGGGLGIPYFSNETSLDLKRVAHGVPRLLASTSSDPALKGTKIILEPGRFLIGSAGVYLSRIQSVKQSRGTTYVVMDGGMHHHLAASGNLGQVIKRDYPQLIANKATAVAETTAVVVGPLCTPLDTIGRDVEIPQPSVGDIMAILQSGAYALTASPSGFLSHPMPAEVLVDDGHAKVIRPRGDFEQPITPLP